MRLMQCCTRLVDLLIEYVLLALFLYELVFSLYLLAGLLVGFVDSNVLIIVSFLKCQN